MAGLSGIAVSLVDHLGVVGIGVGVMLNGFGIPGISEVILPVAGVGVRQGHQALAPLFIIALTGQMIGLIGAYFLAKYGGVELIERYGRYVFITKHELERAQGAFNRYGTPLLLVGSVIPGIQGFVGYVGGLAEMSFARFFVSVLIGKAVWIGALIGLGYALGNNVGMIDTFLSHFGLIVLLLVVALAVVWYSKQRRRHQP